MAGGESLRNPWVTWLTFGRLGGEPVLMLGLRVEDGICGIGKPKHSVLLYGTATSVWKLHELPPCLNGSGKAEQSRCLADQVPNPLLAQWVEEYCIGLRNLTCNQWLAHFQSICFEANGPPLPQTCPNITRSSNVGAMRGRKSGEANDACQHLPSSHKEASDDAHIYMEASLLMASQQLSNPCQVSIQVDPYYLFYSSKT